MSIRDERVNGRDRRKMYPVEKSLIVLQAFTATVANTLMFTGLLLMYHREHHSCHHHL